MAGGWTRDGAVNDQIDDSIADEVTRARNQLVKRASLTHCQECGDPIPEARRNAVPGVRFCVDCQEDHDKGTIAAALYNRRGNKDSQLR